MKIPKTIERDIRALAGLPWKASRYGVIRCEDVCPVCAAARAADCHFESSVNYVGAGNILDWSPIVAEYIARAADRADHPFRPTLERWLGMVPE